MSPEIVRSRLESAFRENQEAISEILWRARAPRGKETEISETLLGLEKSQDNFLEKGSFFARRASQNLA